MPDTLRAMTILTGGAINAKQANKTLYNNTSANTKEKGEKIYLVVSNLHGQQRNTVLSAQIYSSGKLNIAPFLGLNSSSGGSHQKGS